MSDYLKRLAGALKKREAPMGPDAWDWQQFADASPTGSVNAPGGVSQPQERDRPQRLGKLLAGASMLPGPSGDLLGPLSDAYMYATEPESRTPGNFALSALGALPFLPSLATVYHGSPHKFDAFDLSKIGTGEGAQAYGHGLYFAEAPDVAKQYADNVKDMGAIKDINAELSRLANVMSQDSIPGAYRQYKSDVGRQAAQRYDELMDQRSAVRQAPGTMYTVDLPDEAIAKMLDWDKPLSEQPAILNKLRGAGIVNGDEVFGLNLPSRSIKDINGRALVEDLAAQWASDYGDDALLGIDAESARQAASNYLSSLGIPGTRYLDGGSRGAGQGTSNYVVFDDKLPKILKRE